ncbi:MAG TPA: VCBS repeat-containing protein, partial [Myxococcota bacterium]
DLVFSGAGTEAITVFPGLGDGSFDAPIVIDTDRFPRTMAVFDDGHDGDDDIADLSDFGELGVTQNDGAGHLSEAPDIDDVLPASSSSADAAVAADLTGDGVLDIVVVSEADGVGEVIPGLGGGTLAPPDVGVHRAAGCCGGVALAHTDNDSSLDLVVGGEQAILVSRGDGGGGFTDPPVRTDLTITAESIAALDLDGDGLDDLVVASSFEDGALVLHALGAGAYAVAGSVAVGPGLVALGDVDGDDIADLVSLAQDGSLHIARGTGALAFGAVEDVDAAPDGFPEHPDLHLADADGDGTLDIIACLPTGFDSVVTVASAHDVHGAFGLSHAVTGPDDFADTCIARDIDGDGALEVLMAQTNSQTLSVERVVGHVIEPVASASFVGGAPQAFAAVDVDGDGTEDILMLTEDGAIFGFRAAGADAFADGTEYMVPGEATAFAVGNLDHNVSPDLVIRRSADATVLLHE